MFVQFIDAPIVGCDGHVSGNAIVRTSDITNNETIVNPCSCPYVECNLQGSRDKHYTQLFGGYSGLTDVYDCFRYRYVQREFVAANMPISFDSDAVAGFDMSKHAYAWFSDDIQNSTLKCIPPPLGTTVAGLVRETVDENGVRSARYVKWFFPSTEFLKLYTYVMRDKPRSLDRMRVDGIADQLDCGWHWNWQCAGVLPEDPFVGELARPYCESLSMETRRDIIHREKTYLYDDITSCDSMALYYFYQTFCLGSIQEWDCSAKLKRDEMQRRMYFAMWHLIRKRAMRDERRGCLIIGGLRVCIVYR